MVAIVCCYIVAKTAVRHHLHLQFVSITTFFDSKNRALAKLMIFYDFNILSGDAVLFCWQVDVNSIFRSEIRRLFDRPPEHQLELHCGAALEP